MGESILAIALLAIFAISIFYGIGADHIRRWSIDYLKNHLNDQSITLKALTGSLENPLYVKSFRAVAFIVAIFVLVVAYKLYFTRH